MWSVRTADGRIGSGKTTRRFAAVRDLQRARARTADHRVEVELPGGGALDVESADLAGRLSALVGQSVTLARESDVSHFDDGPVSLVARASVEAVAAARGEPVDEARFRPNVVVDGVAAFGEDEWIGRYLHVGSAVLFVEMASERCVMVDSATADLPAQPGNLRAVGRLNAARLGVIARVVRSGGLWTGDPVRVGGAGSG
jgi:uncharacterized protein YcbX